LTGPVDWRKQHAMSGSEPQVTARPGRVLCAMSGGVDSSLAAALLHEAGHEIIGVTLHLWDAGGGDKAGRCCAPEDREDARRTCDLLGVPHYVLDERAAFRAHVVEPFLDENLAGRTPIPCVHCNQHVKLVRLWELARSFGATHVATGHYARVQPRQGDGVALLRGADRNKDQSYFLFGVPERILRGMLFPLGEMTKDQARQEARRLGLPNWNKPDSQELCFVPDGDVAGFIARQRAPGQAGKPGPLVDEQGQVLGQHRGIEGFTIGQRRGLGISAPQPRYVLRVVPGADTVVVGGEAALFSQRLTAERAAWVGEVPAQPFEAEVQIRHRHEAAPGMVTPLGDGFGVEFVEPQRAIAPGQAAVVYQGNTVIGGGFVA
jgi:tRNA-specific 2-thiouridylase